MFVLAPREEKGARSSSSVSGGNAAPYSVSKSRFPGGILRGQSYYEYCNTVLLRDGADGPKNGFLVVIKKTSLYSYP